MKKLIMAAVMLAVLTAVHASAQKETPVEEFEKRAAMAEKDILAAQETLKRLHDDFGAAEKRIESLKAGGKPSFIDAIRLKYHLNRGNRLGFKIYRLEAGIRELKEEHFTYASLLAEIYGARLKSCCEKKCGEAGLLFEKWVSASKAADKFGDLLEIDMASYDIIKNYSPRAAKDAADYLQKKAMQAEQRIYIFSESKSVLSAAKKAGLDISGTEDPDRKIAGLKKFKAVLEKEMSRAAGR